MGEPRPPRNPDGELPPDTDQGTSAGSSDEMGEREPLAPRPDGDRKDEVRPRREEERHEHGLDERRHSEEGPPER